MLTLIISLLICLAILAIIFIFVWRHTDWKKIDEANKMFYDSDGDHVYYDKTRIRMKRDAASQKEQKRESCGVSKRE